MDRVEKGAVDQTDRSLELESQRCKRCMYVLPQLVEENLGSFLPQWMAASKRFYLFFVMTVASVMLVPFNFNWCGIRNCNVESWTCPLNTKYYN